MRLVLILAAAGLVIAPAAARGPQCRDAKSGKFAKCEAPGAVPVTSAAVLAQNPAKVNVDKNGRCHVSEGPKKGQFAACPKK